MTNTPSAIHDQFLLRITKSKFVEVIIVQLRISFFDRRNLLLTWPLVIKKLHSFQLLHQTLNVNGLINMLAYFVRTSSRNFEFGDTVKGLHNF